MGLLTKFLINLNIMEPGETTASDFEEEKGESIDSLLKAVKLQQESRRGVNLRLVGVPGECSLLNTKYKFAARTEARALETRMEGLVKLTNKLTTLMGKRVPKFISSDSVKPYSEYIKFECFEFEEMIPLTSTGPTVYDTPYPEGQELLFKLLKTDARLIRSVCLQHGFSSTEGHNWNLLWTNTAGKPYLYQGLNPYQKINHFPCGYEITRKNCLAPNVFHLAKKFSYAEFGFVPETFILP